MEALILRHLTRLQTYACKGSGDGNGFYRPWLFAFRPSEYHPANEIKSRLALKYEKFDLPLPKSTKNYFTGEMRYDFGQAFRKQLEKLEEFDNRKMNEEEKATRLLAVIETWNTGLRRSTDEAFGMRMNRQKNVDLFNGSFSDVSTGSLSLYIFF